MKNVQFNPYRVVGDCIELSLHSGKIVEGVIKSAFATTAGWKFDVGLKNY